MSELSWLHDVFASGYRKHKIHLKRKTRIPRVMCTHLECLESRLSSVKCMTKDGGGAS